MKETSPQPSLTRYKTTTSYGLVSLCAHAWPCWISCTFLLKYRAKSCHPMFQCFFGSLKFIGGLRPTLQLCTSNWQLTNTERSSETKYSKAQTNRCTQKIQNLMAGLQRNLAQGTLGLSTRACGTLPWGSSRWQ